MCAFAKSASGDPTLASAIADAQRAIQLMREARRKKQAAEAAGQPQVETSEKSPDKGGGKDISVSKKLITQQPIKINPRAKKRSVTSASTVASNAGEDTSSISASPKKQATRDTNLRTRKDKSSARASPKFQLTSKTNMLIKKQKAKLPSALADLKRHKHKVGHWAWW